MEPHKPTRGLRAYATGVQLPHPATASLGLSHPPLAARGLLAPALAILSSLSTLGSCEVRRRDTQSQEVVLLDWRKGVSELALVPDFEH